MAFECLTQLSIYPRSETEVNGTTYLLARGERGRVLCILGDVTGFAGERAGDVFVCPLTPANATKLRERLPWLRPGLVGLRKSVGCGDRLGLATPGHIRAVRRAWARGSRQRILIPMLAQQSVRENVRTGRTPQEVLDDAMWGVFQEGWRELWGADADHLKTTHDIDLAVAAGYTFFTIDPGAHVDNEAQTASQTVLEAKVRALPWDELEASPEDLYRRYLDRPFEVEGSVFEFESEGVARAAAKYGRAIAHTVQMYRHLAAKTEVFELEVSVDETDTPTSPLEHLFFANELMRLGVRWVSLAPRYIGRFEKGVDYIPPSGLPGDLSEFEAELAQHAAIARATGPYKLSIHSGSDKFSVYPIFARQAGDLVHLKTAGTSYLEALRAIARVEPSFFREILALALDRYEEDRVTYHVSAEVARVPSPGELKDEQLPGVLDLFDGREVLHVTFGSVLDQYRERLKSVLETHEEAYYEALEAHFEKHLFPFVS